MKKLLFLFVFVAAFVLTTKDSMANDGFDSFGYNLTARKFVGTCGSWRMGKFLDSEAEAEAYCGDWMNDRLVMKWNAKWDMGVAEEWENSDGHEGARFSITWNGNDHGTKEGWHYRLRWVGSCNEEPNLLTNGGYCFGGRFEMLMDHKSDADHLHQFFSHSKPAGYGSY